MFTALHFNVYFRMYFNIYLMLLECFIIYNYFVLIFNDLLHFLHLMTVLFIIIIQLIFRMVVPNTTLIKYSNR